MAVVVITSREPAETITFEKASGWHISEDLTLHVRGDRGGSGNVAAFGPHRWSSVYERDAATVE